MSTIEKIALENGLTIEQAKLVFLGKKSPADFKKKEEKVERSTKELKVSNKKTK